MGINNDVVLREHATCTPGNDDVLFFCRQPKQEHELPLSIITCVGCGLSILGCILTILTYAFLP